MKAANKPWSWRNSRQFKFPKQTAILCETPLTFKNLCIEKKHQIIKVHYTVMNFGFRRKTSIVHFYAVR